ncbi:DMT family transporter [Mediterraneibacter agrestimuris]|uniref:DMT family transporter n=1 Tax=Mediterraneibacter agrestimuris TaxID=2941333 RepID=UPI002F3FC2CC
MTKDERMGVYDKAMNHKLQLRNSFLLLLTAAIWGVAFVAQSVGMDYVGPFTFNMIRSVIGGIVLIPCIFLLDKISPKEKKELSAKEQKKERKTLLTGGICCGILLAFATNFQQIGIQYTTVGRAGFITACYIIIVPLIGITFFKKKCRSTIWLAVILALVGLYLLCITEEFSIGYGDFLVLICSFLFSLHILVIDYFSPLVDGVKMSCIQFFVCGIVSGIPALFTETIVWTNVLQAWMPVLYAGVMSCGVAYTLQIVGQKNMNPTVASLILSLESCIAVLAGWIILGESLTSREVKGCILMFAAIVLAQMPEKK